MTLIQDFKKDELTELITYLINSTTHTFRIVYPLGNNASREMAIGIGIHIKFYAFEDVLINSTTEGFSISEEIQVISDYKQHSIIVKLK